jgi:hypothetical protein
MYAKISTDVTLRLNQIYVDLTPYSRVDGRHRRPFETVLPLAIDLGLPVDLSCKRNQVRCVAKLVRNFQGPGNILISWRHGRMKEIVEELGSEHVPEYPVDR